jgi:TonB family protein
MSTPSLPRGEQEAFRARSRNSTFVSVAIHLVFLGWLGTRVSQDGSDDVIEVEWLDSEPLAAAAIMPAATAPEIPPDPEPWTTVAPPVTSDAYFERQTEAATRAPRPQRPEAIADALKSRLAALQRDAMSPPTALNVPTSDAASIHARLAGPPRVGAPAASIELRRGGSERGVPLALKRGGDGGGGSALPVARIPDPPRSAPVEAARAESTAVRLLGGASLAGPVADRPVQRYTLPRYPEWATRDAVEASVRLLFFVLPDGRIKESVLVQKTSGFEDFDQNATTALLAWRFEPLPAGVPDEQWGEITFNYRLRDAR